RNIWKFAILGAVVLLLLILVWRWPFSRRGLPATVASRTLAVVEIENLSDDRSLDWLGNGVVELLTSDLAQSKSLGVISTERIRGLIRQRLKSEGHLPPSEAQEVAKEAQADLFASGALLRLGHGLRLDLRVQDTATGRVLFADKVEAENAQAVFATVSVQRQEIARAADLAARLPLPRQQKLVIEATRLSLDGRWEDADEILKVAIREFPRETQPRLDLGGNLYIEGKSEESAQVL